MPWKIPPLNHGRSASWNVEIVSIGGFWACYVFIIVLFEHYDGRKPPRWYLGFSLPALATIPTSIMVSMIGTVIYSCVNQLAHIWFLKGQQIGHLEIFFKAARSAWDAVPLQRLQRFRGIASWATLALLFSQIIATNVQQSISEKYVLVPFGNGYVPICSRLSVRSTDSSSSFENFDDAIIGAVWNGFTGKGGDVITMAAYCPEDVCRWNNYWTIAVSYQCEDVSSEIVQDCEGEAKTNCTFTLSSSGLMISGSLERYNAQAYLNDTFFPDIPWYYAVFDVMATTVNASSENAIAQRCILYPEAKRYSSQSINGLFTERLISTWHNVTTPLTNDPEWLMKPNDQNATTLSIYGPTGVAYIMWFLNWFTGTGKIAFKGSDFAGKDQHQVMNSSLFAHTVDARMNNMALAMSKAIRSSVPADTLFNSSTPAQTAVSGQSFKKERHIHIIWNWLIPTSILGVFTTGILTLTVLITHKLQVGIYKGNILAFMNWAPSDESRAMLESTTRHSEFRHVRNAKFKSVRDGNHMRLQFRG